MTNARKFNVGDRVITKTAKDEPMIGIEIAAGQTGTFVGVEDMGGGMLVVCVRLDTHFDDLDEWDNVLQLDCDEDENDIQDIIAHA